MDEDNSYDDKTMPPSEMVDSSLGGGGDDVEGHVQEEASSCQTTTNDDEALDDDESSAQPPPRVDGGKEAQDDTSKLKIGGRDVPPSETNNNSKEEEEEERGASIKTDATLQCATLTEIGTRETGGGQQHPDQDNHDYSSNGVKQQLHEAPCPWTPALKTDLKEEHGDTKQDFATMETTRQELVLLEDKAWAKARSDRRTTQDPTQIGANREQTSLMGVTTQTVLPLLEVEKALATVRTEELLLHDQRPIDEEGTKQGTESKSAKTIAQPTCDPYASKVLMMDVVQPMPSPRAPREDSTPGAHAVGGPPRCFAGLGRFARPHNSMNSSTDASTRDEESPPPPQDHVVNVVDQGVVVVNAENEQTSRGDMENDMGGGELIEAKVLVEGEDERTSRVSWIAIGALLLLGCLVILLVAFVALPSSRKNDGSDDSPDHKEVGDHGEPILYNPYRDDLPLVTVKGILDIHHDHYAANIWMLEDPNLHSYSYDRQWQRFHMVTMYKRTNGHDWFQNDHWLSYEVPECQWFSKSTTEPVCDGDGWLLTVDLHSNNLHGTFPAVKQFVPSIRIFDVSDNDIHGIVPSLVSSPNLEVFVISNNHFEGRLVGDGGFSAFGLRVVKIDGNQLFGDISPMCTVLPKLEIYNASSNLFQEEITYFQQYCKSLKYLGFAYNRYHGTLPTELGKLTQLQELHLEGNPDLEGIIPTELGLLTQLQHLDVSGTSITGTLPPGTCERAEVGLVDVVANCSQVQCCN